MIRLSAQSVATDAWEKARRPVAEFMRDVQIILNRGVKLSEQVRDVVTGMIDTDAYPCYISFSGNYAPVTVMLASATKQDTTDGHKFSGGLVEWEQRGNSILIHNVSGLSASTRYDAVFVVME